MTGMDVRVRRIRKNLRQVDVAIAAGMSKQRVSALERRRRLTDESARRLLEAIDRAASGSLPTPGEVIPFRPREATA